MEFIIYERVKVNQWRESMTKSDSLIVFERTSGWKFANLTFSQQNLQVLALIDGKITVADICDALKLTVADIAKDIDFLERNDLIQANTETNYDATRTFIGSSENVQVTNSSSADF